MDTPTTIVDPSPRAHALSQDVAGLIRARSAGDPGLQIPDILIALELVKTSVLEESGVTFPGRRIALIVAVALSMAIAGFAVFLMRS